jgi:cardiolipin synthase
MRFTEYISLGLYLGYLLLAIYAAANIIYRKLDPVKSLSWVIVIFALPYVGLFLYAFLGQNFRKIKIYSRKGVWDEKFRKRLSSQQLKNIESNPGELNSNLHNFKKIITLNLRGNQSLLGVNKAVKIFFSGKEALENMLLEIEKAEKHIHLQSYIIEDDIIGNRFKDALISKAKAGVEVRLMYDDVGCWSLPKQFSESLINAGVELLDFAPVRFLTPTSKVNYRNHRKILVVDGKTGFLGGVNIADRYYTGGIFPEWRDTHIKITGESVMALQSSFLLDRYFIINRQFNKKLSKYFPEIPKDALQEGHSSGEIYSQIITSGPDSDWSSIMQCYLAAIMKAKKCICIVTPYFTPNETILNAIKVAALGGVRVAIMLPEKSDSKIAYWCTISYAEELLEAGVEIYLFRNGFNHSKVISIDGEFCIIGSANLDNRSFDHNFEITSIIYDKTCSEIIENKFREDISRCRTLEYSKWARRSKGKRIKESLARLLSPLL